jgi:predicted ATP-dependent endonuclease of OLD family
VRFGLVSYALIIVSLVFLVEAHESNAGAILLLDEAGLSLHPKAQHDLIGFMEELSKGNQIIHTTHSPFLIEWLRT